jgi:hypothetical protein
MAKDDDETGIESIAKEASKDPRMKEIAGNDAETETGETEDEEGDGGIEDCLNEAFDKRNDRAGFVSALKKAIQGY